MLLPEQTNDLIVLPIEFDGVWLVVGTCLPFANEANAAKPEPFVAAAIEP